MTQSNKSDDEMQNFAYSMVADALASRANNSAEHVGQRFLQLHSENGYPVKIRDNSTLASTTRLVRVKLKKSQSPGWRGAAPLPGIIAMLLDETTALVSEYRIESNGFNGVEVVEKV